MTVCPDPPLETRLLSGPLLECGAALATNQLDIAERLLREQLRADPFDVAAIRMMAELAARLGRMTDSENLLRRAVELAPGFTAAQANLALVINRTGRHAEALEMVEKLLAH